MDATGFPIGGIDAALDDARLAVHATNATPAWLWAPNGECVLWANPAGCAAFGLVTLGALTSRRFGPHDPTRANVARIAALLHPDGAVRFERLRGFAGPGWYLHWRPLLCACSRVALEQTWGVLVAATEAVCPPLPLAERVRRLELDQTAAIAAFAPDGAVLFATAPAQQRLGGAARLDAIGAQRLAATALSSGLSSGPTAVGSATIRRIGSGTGTVLLARFAPLELPGDLPHATMSDGADLPDKPGAADRASATQDATAEVLAPQRHPLRFVWQMDASGRFTLGSHEFTEIIGSRAAFALGRPWQDINAELGLDPTGRVEQAIATRETWSSLTVSWPIDGSPDRLEVELSGLPAYDRHRNFVGYRGFGVCRDINQIESARTMRRLSTFAPDRPAPADTPDLAAQEQNSGNDAMEAPPVMPLEPALARNVVPFPGAAAFADTRTGTEQNGPVLSPGEHSAFRELARQLTARLKDGDPMRAIGDSGNPPVLTPASPVAAAGYLRSAAATAEPTVIGAADGARQTASRNDHTLLDRLPIGVLVYRQHQVLFANRTLLEWTGYPDLDALEAAGDIDTLCADAGLGAFADVGDGSRRLLIATRLGKNFPVEGRRFALAWDGEPAFAVVLAKSETGDPERAATAALHRAEAQSRELRAIIDAAAEPILTINGAGRILSGNPAAGALLGRSVPDLIGSALANLLSPDSRDGASAQFAHAFRDPGLRSIDVAVLAGDGAPQPMRMSIIRIDDDLDRRGVILHDISELKDTATAPATAQQQMPATTVDKVETLAGLGRDARTPLNSILGLCDMMLEQRFGPIADNRYRECIGDVRKFGTQLLSLLTEATQLAKIEAGAFPLAPVRVSLNDIVTACVSQIQPHASDARVIVRTSLAPVAPAITADAAAVRQMIAELLGHALKTSRAGGQVIVSTGQAANGEVVLRVRRNGDGLSDAAIDAAMRPAHPPAKPSGPTRSDETPALPLTRALAAANRARFRVTSKPLEGALFELTFATHANGHRAISP